MTHCPKSKTTLYCCSIPAAVADILRHMSRSNPAYEDIFDGYMRSMCATCPKSADEFD
jgi:hypothetical protein